MASDTHYRIFGVELSPYSVKVRSYFRYKQIPHEWVVRDQSTMGEYQQHAKLPIIPLVVGSDGSVQQDSTPILETFEAAHPEPSIHPDDSIAAFVSALLEEFGDEWGNKWMFHYRWAREADQVSASERLVASMMPGVEGAPFADAAAGLRERMLGRVWFVGSSPQTGPQIEESFQEGVRLLDAHLADRPYLFGGRPAFGDFGLWGQVYNAFTDPTAGAFLREHTPRLLPWIERMLEPKDEGAFEGWASLAPTLTPFLRSQVGTLFLPWSVANAAALADGAEEFSVELAGRTWTQKPQKYHAKSLVALRAKYAAARNPGLDALLDETGCREAIAAG
ncbi:MAG: glutathione S-transferase family protein [Myxococcota bacterium]